MSDFVRKTYRKEIKEDTKIDLEPRRGDIVLSGEEIVGVVMADGIYKELAKQSSLEELEKKLPIIQRQQTESNPINVKRVNFQTPQRDSDTPLIIHTYDTDNNLHTTFNVGDAKKLDLKALEKRVEALENNPAGATPTITFTGTPLQLGTGIQSLTYYNSISGETSEISVNILESNCGDDTPVKSLFLIEDTINKAMEITTFRIVSSEASVPSQDFTVEGVLYFSNGKPSMNINIIKGVTEAP